MTINTAMLVGLGFLIAALLAVLIAPAYRRRTVRLTTAALKRSLPLTEAEMRADKDRLRADHAIRIHNLEAKLESVTLSSARQKIEVNRRDARISELEGIANQQKNHIEELENARRVLEQTVTDRLPKIENRLGEAKKLLAQRDTEVSSLAETAQKQARALGEASQINIQQTSEIERLTTVISTRAARNHDTLGDVRFDGEIALRSEIEALRAKSRDQSALITQLQALLAQSQSGAAAETIAAAVAAAKSNETAADTQISRLQAELGEVHGALEAARASADAKSADVGASESELRQLRTANQDLAAEQARLKAALAAYEQTGPAGVKESPIAMKARLSSLDALSREQATTIASLRAEVAAVNERLARQSAHYMDEMKRLGAGTLPASGEARRSASPAAEPVKRPLSDRIQDRRVVRLTPLAEKRDDDAPPASRPDPSALFSLNDPASIRSDAAERPQSPANGNTEAPAAPRRPRLLERITSIDKPGSN